MECGHENTAANPTYCAACGVRLSGAGSRGTSNLSEIRERSTSYLSRLAAVHGFHAALFLLTAVWMWNASPQMRAEPGPAGTTHVYFTTYSTAVIVAVGGIGVLFAIACIGTWAQNRVLWGMGVLWNTVMLVVAVLAPSWVFVPTLLLGLYYGYKSYGSWRDHASGGDAVTATISGRGDGTRSYVSRLAAVHGLHAALFLLTAVWMNNVSAGVRAELGPAGTTEVYYTSYPSALTGVAAVFGVLFALVFIGTWARNRVLWGIGILVNTTVFLLALLPPPTWVLLPTLILASYYGYKSYGSWRDQPSSTEVHA